MADVVAAPSAYEIVREMETDLHRLNGLFQCLMVMVQDGDDLRCSGLGVLADIGLRETAEAEASRMKLFRLTHPRREHFDAVGWPGDQPEAQP